MKEKPDGENVMGEGKEKIKSSEITSESKYLNRRNFLKGGALAGSVIATGYGYRLFNPPPAAQIEKAELKDFAKAGNQAASDANSFEEITNYNNFYEFSTSKTEVASASTEFVVKPWTIRVDGLVRRTFDIGLEEMLKFDLEERIYRFRCVEGWSMVIPWIGFPLKKIIEKAEPKSEAKYVAFQSFYPGANPSGLNLPKGGQGMQSSVFAGIPFPYLEGLRMDEAMHPLAILATGLYGKEMPNQNGAPVRLVVPWKYGFKSIKSIVRISFVSEEPKTTWSESAPNEYGFYSNVNPSVDHPRWSQASERRIGELVPRPTLPFNGYEKEVASLYRGMDLRKNF